MTINEYSQQADYSARKTSQSYVVPTDDPVGVCITSRAENFSGLLPWTIFEELQVVRYFPNEHHGLHVDHMQKSFVHEPFGLTCNRFVSFFVYIGDECTGGETYFPYLKAAPTKSDPAKFGVTTQGGDYGLVVRPVQGNAIFWVNLLQDGVGDNRTLHTALKVEEGVKYGMNILGETCWEPADA